MKIKTIFRASKYILFHPLKSWRVFTPKTKKHIKKIAAVFLIVCLSVPGYLWYEKKYGGEVPEAEAGWWNDAWMYRKAITVSNSSGGALTDFQVKILDNKDLSADITAGKIQADLDDLRFTDINGTVLPYWIEDTTTSSVDVWVKMPSIPTTGATVYFYYGNAQATSEQNGNNVFEFFDDFSGSSLDTGKWSTGGNRAGTTTVSNGELTTDYPYSASTSKYYYTQNNIVSSNHNLFIKVKSNSTSITSDLLIYGTSPGNYVRYLATRSADKFYSDGSSVWTISSPDTNYHLYQFKKNGTSANIVYDGTNQGSFSLPSVSILNIGNVVQTYSHNVTYDYLYITKYASTDPTAGTPATEEKGGAPIASWSFDEGMGATANDSSSNRNNGTLTNMASTADPNSGWQSEDKCVSGKCLAFDGSNDYVEMNAPIPSNSPFSISMWYYPTRINSSYDMLYSGTDNIDFQLFFHSSTKVLTTSIENSEKTGGLTLTSNTINKWYNIVVTYDNSRRKVYIDGVLTANDADTTTFTKDDTKIRIGALVNGGGYPIQGRIDEPRVYPYARTAAQIAKDYNAGLAGMGESSEGISASIGGKSNKWLTDGLVGHWKMDEGTGASTSDNSGNNKNSYSFNAGNESGAPTWSSGKYGNALTFSNVSGQVGNSVSINNGVVDMSANNSFSFFSWVYLTGNTTVSRIFTNGSGCTKNISFHVTDSGGIMRVQITDSSDVLTYFSSGYTVPLNQWKHIGFSFTKNGKIDFFVDGVLINSQDFTVSTFKAVTGNSIIGACTCAYNDGTNGKLDEVRIYNRALSPKEVSDLYNYAPGPIGYWNLDDATGTTAKDLSGNGRNMSFTNSPSWFAGGKFNTALDFDNDDYASSDWTDFTLGPQTIEFWMRADSINTSYRDLVGTTLNSEGNRFHLQSSDNSIIFYSPLGVCSGTDSDVVPTVGEWYHVAGTTDGANTKVYVNGQLKKTSACTTSGYTSTGIFVGGTTEDFDGQIDDVKIYNYARTQKQIVEDMNGGHPAGGSPVGSQVGYWKFDEGSGTTAYNSGNGKPNYNSSLINGTAWTNSGKFGKALDFDGSNDYASLSNPVDLSVDNSISFWFYLKSYPASNKVGIFANSNAQPLNGGSGHSTIVYIDSDGYLKYFIYDGSSRILSSNYSISTGQWYYVTLVNDKVNSKRKIFINGQLKNFDSYISSQNFATILLNFYHTELLYFPTVDYAPMYFDELKIYNYALTDSEIQLDYNQEKSMVLGSKGTESDGKTPSNSASRAYCPPGNVEGNCAPGLSPAPVGEWNFEEGSGTTAKDTSGNGNNGTLNGGATWNVAGKKGGAASFDGSDDYVDAGSGSSLNISNAITVSAWIKADTIGVNSTGIIGKAKTGVTPQQGYVLGTLGTSRKMRFYPIGPQSDYVETTSDIPTNQWVHYQGVYDGSTIKIYINGQLNASVPSSLSMIQSDVSVVFGRWYGNYNSYYFDGLIDDVKIYNYVRTPAQIAWDYNRGAPVGWWRMDEGQGITAKDYSGNGNNGTLTNMDPATDWVAGKNNGALDFDGSNDRISTSALTGKYSGLVSISAWVYHNSTSDWDDIVAGSCGDLLFGFNSNTISFGGQCNSPFGPVSYSATLEGGWHHVAGVYNGSTAKIYLDGNAVQSLNRSGSFTPSALGIGSTPTGGEYFNGKLDDVRIYNYALSAEQVKQIMNDGAVNFR